jgi:hypothetical protein
MLVTGHLGGLIHLIVLKATSGEKGEAVHVYGGSSDLFTFIRADSVVVVNDLGLRVAVFGADVDGSAFDYLFRSEVQCISVDSLVIHTPLPSDGPPDSSLAPIFLGVIAGMVTRAGTVEVAYGRIVDPEGLVLVDSMEFNGKIVDIHNVEIDVRVASVFIPLFGTIRASGSLFVDSTRTTLEGFDINCYPGTVFLSGYLSADSTFDMVFSGSLSSGSLPEFPSVSTEVSGHGEGSIMNPLLQVSLSNGVLQYGDAVLSFAADSLISTRESMALHGFHLSSEDVFISVSGELSYSDLAWDGVVHGVFQNTDISEFVPEFPSTDLSGVVAVSGSGTGSYFNNGRIGCQFGKSRVSEYSVSSFAVECEVNHRELSGTLETEFGGGSIVSVFTSSLGLDLKPVAWNADLDASIADCGFIAVLTDSLLTGACGVSVSVFAEGNMSAFSVGGDVGLNRFSSESINIKDAVFSGFFSTGPSGVQVTGTLQVDSASMMDSVRVAVSGLYADLEVSGLPENFSASGTVGFNEACFNDIMAGQSAFSGEVSSSGEGIKGSGGLSVDSIILAGAHYSLSALFSAQPGSVHLDSLRISAPSDLSLDLSGQFRYGADSLSFTMDGIALTRAGKLRLISEGDLEFVTDSTGMTLDTLWLDLPSGEIAADGWIRGDSLNAAASLSDVDIASFASMLGLSVPVSGILGVDFSSEGTFGDLQTLLSADIQHPTYDEWDQSDSLTIDVHSLEDSLVIDGLWTWTGGVRSGFRVALDHIWDSSHRFDIEMSDVAWLEAELTGVGDELFYLLPMPFKTSGASVSARVEYRRDTADFSVGVASQFRKLYLTDPGIEFPGLSAYFTYPDRRVGDAYNGRVTVTSGEGHSASMEATLLVTIEENFSFSDNAVPLALGGYSFHSDFNRWETLIAGIGWLQISGSVFSSSDNLAEKPLVAGKLNIDQATISMGGGGALEGSGRETSGRQSELPLDLNIRISGDRGIWFRNSYANVELSTALEITTARGQLFIGGEVKAVRGGVYLLGREFRITQGDVRILQTDPLGVDLNIQAEARIRSSVSGAEYTITVTVTGNPEEPGITLAGEGSSDAIDDRDIVTLLTAGMTYGELQQFNSSAAGSVAGNVLGQWLARSIRDDVGLDALQFSPEFSSDSTSLVVNAGKYVLPDLFVSYSSDVFSSDAGTLKAQYFFNRDFFLEGSTKSTLTGNQDPSIELHYTYRY